jgi:hypothetical protein
MSVRTGDVTGTPSLVVRSAGPISRALWTAMPELLGWRRATGQITWAARSSPACVPGSKPKSHIAVRPEAIDPRLARHAVVEVAVAGDQLPQPGAVGEPPGKAWTDAVLEAHTPARGECPRGGIRLRFLTPAVNFDNHERAAAAPVTPRPAAELVETPIPLTFAPPAANRNTTSSPTPSK